MTEDSMSAASLASNYVARAPSAGGEAGPSVPDGLAKQLAQWIPTEALTVYVALAGILGRLLTVPQSAWLLVGCALFDVVLVWYLAVLKTSRAQKLANAGEPLWSVFLGTRPYGEMLLSCIAFVVWVSALPNSLAAHIDEWKPEYGSALVVAFAALIPILAKIAGIAAPPADENAAQGGGGGGGSGDSAGAAAASAAQNGDTGAKGSDLTGAHA
jgi:hypothetical protein